MLDLSDDDVAFLAQAATGRKREVSEWTLDPTGHDVENMTTLGAGATSGNARLRHGMVGVREVVATGVRVTDVG